MMTITLNLSPEKEAQLRSLIARGDALSISGFLAQALAPTVEAMLSQSSEELSIDGKLKDDGHQINLSLKI